ncbi:Lum_binding domain-containing protein [Cephalotus follicularis]|uniref:Riboflavin synthase n=1 Tax=Cephalotus follicularis TaxID=3775 RepID=A0A1Q3BRR5_CEPFO|nr:Lum_binding domain-containing protein [Cephalotus follicularis]
MATITFSFTSLSKTHRISPSKTPKNFFIDLLTTKKHNLKFTNPITRPSSLTLFSKTLNISTPKTRCQKPTIRSLFTGIVEEIGEVKQLGPANHGGFDLKINAKIVLQDVNLGDSISVNGTCLTVTEFDTHLGEFTVGLSPETLRKTSLEELEVGSSLNLERALKPTTRMGGHFVQGHVDGTGEIVSMDPEGDSLWIKVKVSRELLKYVVPKGFIAVDGTSLTVVDVFDEEGCFNFMLVAYTQRNVILPLKKVGQKVNLEVDILGKYVERLLGSGFLESIKAS